MLEHLPCELRAIAPHAPAIFNNMRGKPLRFSKAVCWSGRTCAPFRRFYLTDPSGAKSSFPSRLCIFVLVSFLMMQLLENPSALDHAA
jgi:hypothetical protein